MTDEQAIRALAVSLAQELDVHVNRVELSIRNLLGRGLIERCQPVASTDVDDGSRIMPSE